MFGSGVGLWGMMYESEFRELGSGICGAAELV